MLQSVVQREWTSSERASYPAIGDYAIVGDCRTAALISREGSIDWLCLPEFSGPAVFAALLDQRRGGRFSVEVQSPIEVTRRYVGPTPVLETTFRSAEGVARLTDLMPVTRNPAELRPMREVLRVIEGLEGTVDFRVLFEPRPDYARIRPRLEPRGALGWACAWGDELLNLHADVPLEPIPDRAAVCGSVRLAAGERRCLSLSYVKSDIGVIAPLGDYADQRLAASVAWWKDWSSRCRYAGPYGDAVLRSAITLKLLTYSLSGAVVAAPTTSLPEAIGADRNWDYRYCWLRDAALTMRAFTGLGLREEAEAFLSWLLHATRLTWPELQVVYDVYGRTRLREQELDHLEGYAASRPVRIGNDAHDQRQLDVYGNVVLAAYDYVESGGRLQRDQQKLLAGFGQTVCKRWQDPDNGIWEIRGARRHYTFSKVMCWSALDVLVKLAERGLVRIDEDRFRRERDAIAEIIESRGFNDALSSYASELGGDRLDASLLLMTCLGYKDAAHPRMRDTYAQIQRRLGRNGLLYRYERGYDGIESPEGAFGICSFWAIDTLARRGDVAEAERCLEHVLAFANDLGLFAEEFDPETGAALGNFPQAFTHVGLINAALALAEASKAARSSG